ncbi:MAG: DUF5049 domain-containing protein [Limosilactobacillus pontis]|uniref:DUF5049 domain-containing protein n=1 Tax=Limosilactobacillus pontis TaxID=35787 RepID=A0A2J6NNA8_9LACO|nr:MULTISPECIES: DUF5049 domain-containing protein [Lactobacillaceae]AOW74214.1 hypothetical protein A4V11_03945 [Pediococcus acidilactici]MDD9323603.1 DUF5049 domain-containing protein [Pediococcus acidilactici]PMB82716.1 DUF5049 domain-containing protein [Limosilactobacillus pontis]
MNRIKEELAQRDRIRQQVLQIRNTGETNMFDVENVKRLAYYYNCHDLIKYLNTDRAGYIKLILTGKFN